MITKKEGFFLACEAGIRSIKGSALNLPPLARLLRPNQLVPLMAAPVFITGKKMLTQMGRGGLVKKI